MKNFITSRHLKNFIKEIQYKNRNPRDLKAIELLDDISTNPERLLDVGTLLYRCRIVDDIKGVNKEKNFWGYNAKYSFVPSPSKAKDMRANYRYIPYLYCANHPYLALVEVRPRLGAQVSVATISVNEEIRLLDFTMQAVPSKMSNSKKNLFADLSQLYSKPITRDDDILDYIPTQYIAEYAKNLGYDGIAFRSSLVPELGRQTELDGYNIVVFNYKKCRAIRSNLFEINGNYIDCVQIDSDSAKMNIHSPAWDMKY